MDKKDIVYQQRFQNACKTVDLVLYSRSKSAPGYKSNQPKFVRKCLAKEKLESLEEERQYNDMMDRCKKNTCRINFVKDKSKKFKTNPIANQVTWGELFQQQNSEKSQSQRLDINSKKYDKIRDIKKKQKPAKENTDIHEYSLTPSTIYKHVKPHLGPLSEIDRNLRLGNPVSELKRKNAHTDVLPSQEFGTNTFVDQQTGLNKINLHHNLNRVCSDQTHSPFGESAIQLLHQLEERLKSQGDDEGFNMVSAIGAYLKIKRSDDSPISLYPTVFSTPNLAGAANVHGEGHERFVDLQIQMKEKDIIIKGMEEKLLKMEEKIKEKEEKFREQEEKIKSQSSVIQELRDLATKLIEYHEQIKPGSQFCQNEDNVSLDKYPEVSNSEKSDSRDKNLLKQLSFENQTLLKKGKSQLDFILNLELELANLRREIKKVRNEKDCIDSKLNQRSLKEESEVDSAFDEKISSRSASGGSSLTNTSSRGKSLSVPRCLPKIVVKSAPSVRTTRSAWPTSILKEPNSFCIQNNEGDTLKETEDVSVSSSSSFASNSNLGNNHFSCLRNDDNVQTANDFTALDNDKTLHALHYQYLESTHVDKFQKTSRISPSFSKPLNNIEMYFSSDSEDSRVKLSLKSLNPSIE